MTHVSGTLQLHADGTPVNYEWSTQGAKKASATIGFNGPTATIELRLEGRRPFTQRSRLSRRRSSCSTTIFTINTPCWRASTIATRRACRHFQFWSRRS